MAKNRNNVFWISYADLMTSLFFVMLVLFILVFVIMKGEQNRLKIRLAEYDKIEEMKLAINSLDTNYFKYDPVNKRHELRVGKTEMFVAGTPKITEDVKNKLYLAGKALRNVTQVIKDTSDVRYLVIIEGMAAKYMAPSQRWKNENQGYIDKTYNLSYERARALFDFWSAHGIKFDENRFEIIYSGSGWFGTGRYNSDMTDVSAENANKRILIQIIPKIGEIGNEELSD